MMIFVYEYATAGGLERAWDDPELRGELLAEGDAMRRALIADLTAAGYEACNLLDAQCDLQAVTPRTYQAAGPDARGERFDQLVRGTAAVLLIAPEIDGILTRLAARVESARGRLLSPGAEFVALTSDKQKTAEWLRARNVPVPNGWMLAANETASVSAKGPWLRKRIDGAGSTGVERVAAERLELRPYATRIERYCAGQPASVALLCGPDLLVPLLPCTQEIATDGSFAYRGGRLPLSPALEQRARVLAISALQGLPKTQGYVGVDLVLGEAADGSRDYVLEVNPRLTTSYIGLRQAARTNLAAAMVQVAQGIVTSITFSSSPLRFSAAGEVCTG